MMYPCLRADNVRQFLCRLLSNQWYKQLRGIAQLLPRWRATNVWPDEYMNLIRRAKNAVDIPIIGSLNGVSAGGWTDYAALMEEAGADAIELNVYYIPTNEDLKGS